MIDTHTHLYLPDEFPGEEGRQALLRALGAGVGYMVLPNVGLDTVQPMLDLHREFPHNTAVAIGLHPTEIGKDWQQQLGLMRVQLDNTLIDNSIRLVAIGEVGIDLYWDKTYRGQQMKALDTQLHWAEELGLPVIIHCREGVETIIEVLKGYTGELPQLIFHSFTGTAHEVRALREFGDHYFGVNGVATFKNAESVREAILEAGLDRLLLETDSPYLAPVPKRGKRNESAYVVHTATKVAELFGVDIAEVEQITDANAQRVFGI